MKIENDKNATVAGSNLESHAMGIDAAHMGHIINLLTDAYSNPVAAVVREYSANALDANRAADNDAAIRVTLPTTLTPMLVIEDEGLGLTKDEIIRVYAQYGASTKRDTNSQIGGFGIGAKSAFTVSNSFTVTSVKDGMKTSVVFTRTDEGGAANVIKEQAVDAPNGVRVSIPVKGDFENYAEEAQNIFHYWNPEDVNVLNGEIDHFITEGVEINERVRVARKERGYGYRNSDRIAVRVGGIGYKLSHEEVSYLGLYAFQGKLNDADLTIVMDAPIGSIDLATSRESLMMNEKGRETVQAIAYNAQEALSDHYKAQIDEQTDLLGALKFYYANKSAVDALCKDKQWNGQPLPMEPTSKVTSAVARVDGNRVKVHEGAEWGNVHTPIFIIDTTGTALKAGKFSYKSGRYNSAHDVDGTAEQVALLDGKRGVVRRHMSAYLRSITGVENDAGFTLKNYSNTIFLLAHEVKDDPVVMARPHVMLSLDGFVEAAKAFQAAQRAANGGSAEKTKSVGGSITYSTVDHYALTIPEIVKHDNIYYTSVDSLRSVRDSMSFYAAHLPKNSVIVALRNTQKTDAFLSRIKKASDGKKEAIRYQTFQREAVEGAVAKLKQAELAYIERAQHGRSGLYDRVLEPIHEDSLITSKRFQKKLKAVVKASTVKDEASLKVLMQQVSRMGITLPEADTGVKAFVAEYPIIEVFSRALSWHGLEDEDEAIAALRQTVLAIDFMAENAPAKKPTKKAVKKAA